jgi:rhodanese-related sulfurtransferase
VITPDKLARLVALPGSPHIIDLRDNPAEAIPGSRFRAAASSNRGGIRGNAPIVVVDAHGRGDAVSAAAILRSEGKPAEVLDGGFAAWVAAGLPTVSLAHLPERHDDDRTWWVTRARPKVDRIACPWLIRRFVDPDARFLFVAPGEVLTVATREKAKPFDIADERVFWSHRGDRCTFDAMVDAFGLGAHEPLTRLAAIVRGADTDRLDAAPEAPDCWRSHSACRAFTATIISNSKRAWRSMTPCTAGAATRRVRSTTGPRTSPHAARCNYERRDAGQFNAHAS